MAQPSVNASPADNVATARGEILDAAEAVFAERGYGAASTREIAERAGIGKRMLFYYFANKDELYASVLDRLLSKISDLHALARGEPAAVGLRGFIAALLRFAAANPDPIRILSREILDEGKHLDRIAERYVRPLYEAGSEEVSRSTREGVFEVEDPMHALLNIGGMTVFYVLTAPLTARVLQRDPLDPAEVERHIEAATRFALGGMLGATATEPEREGS